MRVITDFDRVLEGRFCVPLVKIDIFISQAIPFGTVFKIDSVYLSFDDMSLSYYNIERMGIYLTNSDMSFKDAKDVLRFAYKNEIQKYKRNENEF